MPRVRISKQQNGPGAHKVGIAAAPATAELEKAEDEYFAAQTSLASAFRRMNRARISFNNQRETK